MTIEETENLLNILYVNYPSSYKGWTEGQKEGTKKIWQAIFANLPYEIVLEAVTTYMRTVPSQWAPKPGEINAMLISMIAPDSETEATYAWKEVIDFIHKYPIEDTEKYYGMLQPRIRKVMAVPDLKQMHLNTSEQNQNFERPRFMKAYKAVKESDEFTAIRKGNLLSIADVNKVCELAIPERLLLPETSK